MEIKEIILFSFTMEMDFLPSHNIGKWLSQQKKKKILQMMFLCHHLAVIIHFFDKKADKQHQNFNSTLMH
jgi:C4-dicarboxylate transporter